MIQQNDKIMTKHVNFKSLRVNKTTSQITLEHENPDTMLISRQLEAISVLLGGYNVYGRSIDIDKHRDRVKRFMSIIEETYEDLR